jgi:CheY-like chemotaxis protein
MITEKTKYILIIDDSLDQQSLLKMVLEKKGYSTECQSNAEDALKFLKSNRKKPDTILLDLNMPGMGGLGFRQIQRNDPTLKNIPVLIMSGIDDPQGTESKINLKILKKPFSIVQLLEMVEQTFSLS